MALNEDVVEAVANANFKSMAELGMQNALSHQNRCNIIAETAMGRVIDCLNNTSVPEGLGIAAAQRGDISKVLAELNTVAGSMASLISKIIEK